MMTRTKSMEPDQNAAMRALVRRLVEERFEGNRTKAAMAFGVSQPYLYEFLETENRGAGMKLLRGVAAYLHVGIDDVVAGREKPVAPEPRAVVYDDQYPARADAVVAARALKTISEEAITQVQSICYKHEGASLITAEEWLDKMRAAQRDLDRGLVAPRMAPGEVDPLDEEPPINKLLDVKAKKGKGRK